MAAMIDFYRSLGSCIQPTEAVTAAAPLIWCGRGGMIFRITCEAINQKGHPILDGPEGAL